MLNPGHCSNKYTKYISIHKWAVDLNEKKISDERLTRQTVLMVELMVTCFLKLYANDDMSTVLKYISICIEKIHGCAVIFISV